MFKNKIIWIVIAGMVLHLVASAILPLSDPSEARYATIAKNMADSGNYIMPQIWIDGKLIPYMGKPPFAFWMMATSIKIFGANEFAVRFPSFIASLLMLALMYYILKRYMNYEVAITSLLVAVTAVGFFIMSGAVLVDIWLFLFSIGAVFLYYAFVLEKSRKLKHFYSLMIFLFLGLGFLTKGPVALIFFGLPVFFWTLLNNRWDTLGHHVWFTGLLLFCIITVPWFVLAEESTPGFLKYFFLNENFYRFVSPDKSYDLYSSISHHMFPGAAIVFAFIACLPWGVFQLFYYFYNKNSYNAVFRDFKWAYLRLKKNIFKREIGFSIFFAGVVFIPLFWCISSHIMFYYMTLVTPLYAVWVGETLYKYRFPLKNIIKISSVLLVLYAIGCIPTYFIINSQKSTKSIVDKAVNLHSELGSHGRIVFVRRMEYSSYFYGNELVFPHGKERVEESFMHHSGNYDDIYIIKQKYLQKLSDGIKHNYNCEYKDNSWALLIQKKSYIASL